jgi:hypothetical protein
LVLEIHVDAGDGALAPGDTLRGTLQWVGDRAPEAVELRLLWYTEGRGDQDVGVARTLRIEAPAAVGSSPFEFETPSGPYSCSGRLISIRWALEAMTQPGKETARAELVLAPGGCEVQLGPPAA